jgi:hypothetical protein
MILQQRRHRIHLSHFHSYVSAYFTTKETVGELEQAILLAQEQAKESKDAQIVEQDCLEHLFIVFPSGSICLYRLVGDYEIDNNA